MHENDSLDIFDLRLLAALQEDGQLTNQQLAEQVYLSPSQCSRRRSRLEKLKIIRRYRAELAADRLGLKVMAFVHVTLSTHSPDGSKRFKSMIGAIAEIQEAHALTGDMDYLLKILVADLKSLADVINDGLLPHDTVSHVRSSIVLETLKDANIVPLPLTA
jgi:DNA-binding Lrp family transcriptional regulator